jgi:hypothetical protein
VPAQDGGSIEGDSHEVRVNNLPDVEHSWMLPEQHTTFANGSEPASGGSAAAAVQ